MLINYAAAKDRLEDVMLAQIKKYRKVAKQIDEKYINLFMSEYIAHRIFQKNGLLNKYLKQKEIMNLPAEHYNYLLQQIENPWRFSFAVILNSPEDDFFMMGDVFTGDEYLLFSPGMKTMAEESQPVMWFNLIANNGKCWQTFGLIIPFKSIFPDDVFFFATEINPQIRDEEMLMEEVEKNPWPFFMLINYSNTPQIITRQQEMQHMYATDYQNNFDAKSFSNKFIIDRKKNVYRISLQGYDGFPHFSIAYYNADEKELLRSSMTQIGFDKLTEALNNDGLSLPLEADIAVSPTMLIAAGDILNRKINLNRYEKIFDLPKDENDPESLNRLNHFFELALPYYNEQKEIDVAAMSKATGLDEENVRSLWQYLKLNAMNNS
jgi:hypothetical protein